MSRVPDDHAATYEVRRSARRTRTMTAFREGDNLVVVVPARMTARQQRDLVPGLVAKFLAKETRQAPPRGDDGLTMRARALFDAHLAPVLGHAAPPFGVRWVATMRHRWGSCTPSRGEIRLSDRLRDVPAWVTDYVLVHEMVHLVEAGHTARFWALTHAYPQAVRAQGFLEGIDHATRTPSLDQARTPSLG